MIRTARRRKIVARKKISETNFMSLGSPPFRTRLEYNSPVTIVSIKLTSARINKVIMLLVVRECNG